MATKIMQPFPNSKCFSVFVVVLFLAKNIKADLDEVWFDSFADGYSTHWQASTDGVATSSNVHYCTKPDCVKIAGLADSDNYIDRTIPLQLISNLASYDTFILKYDVYMVNMESIEGNYCEIKVKYDTDDEFVLLKQVAEPLISDQHITNEIVSIPIDRDAQTLQIRLETNGDSSRGFDYCYWDEIGLYGLIQGDIIWQDDMSDIQTTGWITSGNVKSGSFVPTDTSVFQGIDGVASRIIDVRHNDSRPRSIDDLLADGYESHQLCVDKPCVQIAGATANDDFVAYAISDVHEYYDLLLQFDAILRNMHSANGCQVWYRYATMTEWKLLRSIGGTIQNQQIWNDNLVRIPPPKDVENTRDLLIKFQNNADAQTNQFADEYCYIFNVCLKGKKISETDGSGQSTENGGNNQYHLYLLGDHGGTNSFPYTTHEQWTVAAMMETVAYTNDYEIEGVIALGDNFYDFGVTFAQSRRFFFTFEQVYDTESLQNVSWYPVAGNHDHRANVYAQIQYSAINPKWKYPNEFYVKRWEFGHLSLEWIAIDTFVLCGFIVSGGFTDCDPPRNYYWDSEQHWDWIEQQLAASTADFIIVGAHVPIYSYNYHGPSATLIARLKPMLLRYGVRAYISGHEHVMQFIEDEDNSMQHIISGGGHECRHDDFHINNELNMDGEEPLKFMHCNQGGFVRLTVDVEKETMQAFYYLGDSPNVRFFSGIWYLDGRYETINEVMQRTANDEIDFDDYV